MTKRTTDEMVRSLEIIEELLPANSEQTEAMIARLREADELDKIVSRQNDVLIENETLKVKLSLAEARWQALREWLYNEVSVAPHLWTKWVREKMDELEGKK